MRMKAICARFVSVVCRNVVCRIGLWRHRDVQPVRGQWVTERSDNIVLKCSLTRRKFTEESRCFLQGGRRARKSSWPNKTFKVTDYSQEFAFGSVGTSLLGGQGFSQSRMVHSGHQGQRVSVSVGIVNIDKLGKWSRSTRQKSQRR